MKEKKFNPWLPNNERIRDFIRWDNVIYGIILYFFCIGMFSWWGILIGLVLQYFTITAAGGMCGDVFDEYPYQETKPTKSLYSEEFNLKYEKSLKWWQKIV